MLVTLSNFELFPDLPARRTHLGVTGEGKAGPRRREGATDNHHQASPLPTGGD